MNNNGGQAYNIPVPLLGAKEFTCKNGHTYKAPQAWRFVMPITPQQNLTSGPMCPMCFLDQIAFANPSWEKGLTLNEAVATGVLDKRVLQEGDGGVLL